MSPVLLMSTNSVIWLNSLLIKKINNYKKRCGYLMYKKILLAIDESENSNRAIEKVIELQKSWDCEVIMFHSIKHNNKSILLGSVITASSGSYYISERELKYKIGEDILLAKEKYFDKAKLLVETRLIFDDSPEEYIEKSIEKEKFDLVVIGTKGYHSKLREILLGSVAQNVVKHALCDVLIIR